ncbi:proteinaceous RNase P 1, chloroplastic/mitochondrial-like [Andrographis paniculata]|uniref:proteinaceous RNase P 1, chloroplastic/mitochondrial-like n=1 Tax=Andrographis paniculata TaxID=175694 RepID=UPI0021E92BE1|nr:proteinaceous RNase P 1, chloroplastic/mitochondrial-like [Andrographis paniculata]
MLSQGPYMASPSPFQLHFSSSSHCKCPSPLETFHFRSSIPSLCLSRTDFRTVPNANFLSRCPFFFHLSRGDVTRAPERNRAGAGEAIERRDARKYINEKMGHNSRRRNAVGSVDSSSRLKGENLVESVDENKIRIEGETNGVNVVVREKKTKKPKIDPPETILRIGLDSCSKRGDVVGALKLYALAKMEGVQLGQYHYAVLLYLCSSAATGMVQPAKSGSGSRSLSSGDPVDGDSSVGTESMERFGEMAKLFCGGSQNSEEAPAIEHLKRAEFDVVGNGLSCRQEGLRKFFDVSMGSGSQTLEGLVREMKDADFSGSKHDGIQISNDVKRFALQSGFEMYNEMCREKVPVNEAILTSVARMAMAFSNGEMAFDAVKKMKEYGINPRLRSYGPALAIFCNNGDVDNAFMVEKHMLENGVDPEEPELEALLRVSIEVGKSDKVYYILHKLRTNVRQVSEQTADLIERWFKSKIASRVGKRRWNKQVIMQAMENGGGGWHGKGWLGQGKWTVCRSPVGSDGSCKSCGERLATIDLDPVETENFAESVAALASRREKNSNFQKFQKWLDYYGPFEAVVDAANIGLYSQRKFKPSKVNAVVNGIRQMLPSRKWPLVVLHNRRITGEKMDEPFNRSLIEKWRNADALYATPTGSNDDWYWLYAAIKFRCLIVTNDEMRDHLFQLLGNDFFPKWKERHQVHFTFTETGPVFHMPPPCSIVIQESEKGHWHIPIMSDLETEHDRMWLCCTRENSGLQGEDSSDAQRELHLPPQKSESLTQSRGEPKVTRQHKQVPGEREIKGLRLNSNSVSIIQELESAEALGGCVIDFQI